MRPNAGGRPLPDRSRPAPSRLAPTRASFPGALVAYAVKANADSQLLRRLVADGAGCEVVTAVELALALRAGCPAERIVMNGVGKRDEELHLALAAGALINAESLDELGRLVALAADHAGARVGLRLNPALDAGTHPHLATGAASAKFGISLADLATALGLIRDAGLPLAALGAHIGSQVESAEPFGELALRLEEAAAQASAAGMPPERIGPGGGGGGTSAEDDSSPTWPPQSGQPSGVGGLILESRPARWWPRRAADTRVVRRSTAAAAAATVEDAGMTEVISRALGTDHPVSLVAAGAPFARPAPRRGIRARLATYWPGDLDAGCAGKLVQAGVGALCRGSVETRRGDASTYNGRLAREAGLRAACAPLARARPSTTCCPANPRGHDEGGSRGASRPSATEGSMRRPSLRSRQECRGDSATLRVRPPAARWQGRSVGFGGGKGRRARLIGVTAVANLERVDFFAAGRHRSVDSTTRSSCTGREVASDPQPRRWRFGGIGRTMRVGDPRRRGPRWSARAAARRG